MLHLFNEQGSYRFDFFQDFWLLTKEEIGEIKKTNNCFVFDENLVFLKKISHYIWEEMGTLPSLTKKGELLTKVCEWGTLSEDLWIDTWSDTTTNYWLRTFSTGYSFWGQKKQSKFKKKKKKDEISIYRWWEYIYNRVGLINTIFYEEKNKKKHRCILTQIWAYGQIVKSKPLKKYNKNYFIENTIDWIIASNEYVKKDEVWCHVFNIFNLKELNTKNPYYNKIVYFYGKKVLKDWRVFFIGNWKKMRGKNKKMNYLMQFKKDFSYKVIYEIKPFNNLYFVDANPEFWISCWWNKPIVFYTSREGWSRTDKAMCFVDIETNELIFSKDKNWNSFILLSLTDNFSSWEYLKIFPSPKAKREKLKVKDNPKEFAVLVVNWDNVYWKFIDFTWESPYWLKHFENKKINFQKFASFKTNHFDYAIDYDNCVLKEQNYLIYAVSKCENSMFSLIEYYTLDNLKTPIFTDKIMLLEEETTRFFLFEQQIIEWENGDIFSTTITISLENLLIYVDALLKKLEKKPTKEQLAKFIDKSNYQDIFEMLSIIENLWGFDNIETLKKTLLWVNFYKQIFTNKAIWRNWYYPIFFWHFSPLRNKWRLIWLIHIQAFNEEEQKRIKNPIAYWVSKKILLISYDLNTKQFFVLSNKKWELPVIF